MPRYFFDFSRNDEVVSDNDGLTLLDHQAALEEATMACGEMIRTIDGHLQPGNGWRIEVTDETGKLIYRLRLIAESFQ
jgi:hypothetical protein